MFDLWYCLFKSYNRSSPNIPPPSEICSPFLTSDLLPNVVLCYKSTGFFNQQNKCTHQKHSEFVLAIYFIPITKRFAYHLFKAACGWISTPGM